MNKKPILGRLILVIIILVVFGWSMFPLTQQNFYKELRSMTNNNPKVEKVIALAKEKEKADKNLFPTTAVELAAKDLNVDLAKIINIPDVLTNQQALRIVRSKCASSIKLGLDLNGGTEFDVSVIPNKVKKGETQIPISQLRDRVMDILRNRINKSGLVEPEIAAEGSERISLKIPVSTEEQKQEYKRLIQMSAKLEFRLLAKNNAQLVSEYNADKEHFIPPVGYERMTMVNSNRFGKKSLETDFVQIHPQMSGMDITNANVVTDQYGQRQISLEFNSKGAQKFGEVTSKNVGRRLGIVLDGTLYSAPNIQTAIYGGNASISGDFSQEEASNVATALACGNLPATIHIDSVFDTAPTLGKESVYSGSIAGILGLIGVGLFMLIYYMKAGLVANIALIANVILIVGAMASLGATLTLPGIAAIILTIGMAVDANVLIYERIREEIESNKTLTNAIDIGYKRAFITIFDSNITTLLVGLILYWQGSGPVKGFGATLSIGIVCSMFTAIFVTRLIFDIYNRYFHIRKLTMLRIFHNTKIKFLSLWKYCIIISLCLMIASITIGVIKHKTILGVDFTGGTQIVLNYQKHISQGKVKKFLGKEGYQTDISYKSSPIAGNKIDILIDKQTRPKNSSGEMSTITQLLNKQFPNAKFSGASETSIGGLVGSSFATAAIIAILLSFAGMIIYVSLRFELTYAIAAIIALLHDVIIGTGVLIAFDRQISLTVVAALLTVVGYSVNDTIIVFDRIRENLKLRKDLKYREIIDLSINQTLSRTVITSFLTFVVVLVLYIFGGVSINNFALIMLAGIIVGTYSSIFVASPLVAHWHKKVTGIKD
ncbi:MAG TPA: protein translocase subunit SecD [Victivallales bacterium]|nr:protein translocase subunit SecD [Victivallales bacterium]